MAVQSQRRGKTQMALQETYTELKELLSSIQIDLEKAEGGNKAAAQRVRTGTVKLEKVAKVYRKESIDVEKDVAKPAAKEEPPVSAKSGKKKPPVAAKAKPTKAKVSSRSLNVKRPTAKIPSKKRPS